MNFLLSRNRSIRKLNSIYNNDIDSVFKIGVIFFIVIFFLCDKKNHQETMIHSHNDYSNPNPLRNALEYQCGSIEADIYLVDTMLLVAHDSADILQTKSLENMYLEPLFELFLKKGKFQFMGNEPLILMIDVKSQDKNVYQELKKHLEPYRDMLCEYSSGGVIIKPLMIVLSGNRPIEEIINEKNGYLFLDGRLEDLEQNYPLRLFPIISADWNDYFTWTGCQEISQAERENLSSLIRKVHNKKCKIRFWGTIDSPVPQRNRLWRELLRQGVDYINTDSLSALKEFIAHGK